MNTGAIFSPLSPDQVAEHLKITMAAGNFEIVHRESRRVEFRHGTYLTRSAPLLPKRGTITIEPQNTGSLVRYSVGLYGFPKYWTLLFGILLCWLIFPPIIIYRAHVYHPRRLIENLLRSLD